jgi:hypothetical protein
MSNKKMITTARNLDTILKIAEGFMMAFAIVFAVFVVLMKIFKEKMVMGTFSLDLSFVKLYLSGDYGNITDTLLNHFDLILITGCVGCIAIRFGLKVLRSILAPMKEGRPFDMEVSAGLRKLAWVILVGGGLIQAVNIVGGMLLAKNLPMDVIFSSPAIESVEYVFTMDFGFVWKFVVVMLLARIFAYGQQLQQESDETL